MAFRSTLRAGEDYASASDLLASEDLHQDTLRIWDKAIRVRGLTLAEREEIRATAWREDGQRDMVKLVRAYLKYGIVVPRLDDEQVDRFVRKHAWAVEQIYLYIDRLTELPYELVVAQATALAGLAPGAESDQPGGEQSQDDGSVDRPAGKARGRRTP